MPAQVALTQNQMYDAERRLLELVPGIDLPTPLSSGVAAPSQPDPNNNTIQDALNYAIDWVNRKVRCGPVVWISPISVAAAGAGILGGLNVDIASDDSNTLLIREATDAVWAYTANQGGVNQTLYRRLEPLNYAAMLSGSTSFPQYPAQAQPTQWYITGTTVVLVPPPNVAGTLYLMQTEGIPQLDGSATTTITGPPVGLHSVIYFKAAATLSARQGTNLESQQRFERYDALANDGLGDIIAWKQGFDPALIDVLRDSGRMVSASEQQRRGATGQRGVGT